MSTNLNIQNTDIVDGGMGHMLRRLGVGIDGSEPGAIERFRKITMANVTNPEIVQEAHLAFLKSGCNIITTNNYAAVPKCLLYEVPKNTGLASPAEVKYSEETESKTISDILKEAGFFDEPQNSDSDRVACANTTNCRRVKIL